MNHNLKQQGFSAVEALLILVIIGLLGGSGYYVLNAKKNADKSLNNAASQEQSVSPSSSATPGQFQNKDLGFKFEYPKEWGTAVLNNDPGIKGTWYKLTFSQNDKHNLSFFSKDYETAGLGGGCGYTPPSHEFVAFSAVLDPDYFIQVKVNEPNLSIAYKGDAEGECPMVAIARKKIADNNKVGSIDFRYFNSTNTFSTPADISKYYDDPTFYFPQADQDVFLEVARSITEI